MTARRYGVAVVDDHADCIWIGDVNGDGEPELVIEAA